MSDIIKPGTIIEDPKTGVRKMCISVNTHSNHDANSYDEKYTEYIWRKLPFTGYGEGGGNLIEKTFTQNGTYDNTNVEATKVVREIFDAKTSFNNGIFVELTKVKADDKDLFLSTGNFCTVDSSGNYVDGTNAIPLSSIIENQEYVSGVCSIVSLNLGILILFVNDGPATNELIASTFPGANFSSGRVYIIVLNSNFAELPEGVFTAFETVTPSDEPFDGFSKVTVDVPVPPTPCEWNTYTAPDGSKFYYSYSEDGRDMYVLGKGHITSTSSDFYCQGIPWNNDPRRSNLVRIVVGSDITYSSYAFRNCSGMIDDIDRYL